MLGGLGLVVFGQDLGGAQQAGNETGGQQGQQLLPHDILLCGEVDMAPVPPVGPALGYGEPAGLAPRGQR
ncbi:hypothetical protein JCM19379_17640 [Methyloparacoccus murrellii]